MPQLLIAGKTSLSFGFEGHKSVKMIVSNLLNYVTWFSPLHVAESKSTRGISEIIYTYGSTAKAASSDPNFLPLSGVYVHE